MSSENAWQAVVAAGRTRESELLRQVTDSFTLFGSPMLTLLQLDMLAVEGSAADSAIPAKSEVTGLLRFAAGTT
jgi:hypothetical protein